MFRTLCLLVLGLFVNEALAQTPAKYSFAVVPQYSAVELHKDWAPLIARLSKDTGLVFELKIQTSIPLFEASFLKGEPDFAYMNPYHMVMAKKAQLYVPILRDAKPLTGVLVVRKDGSYKTLKDLNGQKIAFPAPNAFGASLYMRTLLSEVAHIQFAPVYVKTHSNVYRNVIREDVAAGGTVNVALNDEIAEVREQLQILYQTPPVASHPVVAHPRVAASVQKVVAQAFFALTQDAEGRSLLNAIRIPAPVAVSYQVDYLPLEKLQVEKYLIIE
ncbi:phosphate/phosphite/phosphonate ABC transporter substrate-binding protein [Undibacterium sp. Ren11W]|uniref:phosphate/phosphite/phosphonate ABC transporter substrate-binding protein n=1 Tax=Undibacterium sp. Ren11W TaxID=3413045 RepID=UPI003BF1C5C9